MYDSKTGIKIQRLTQAQYDHLFYLLLYSSKKRPRPFVNINSPRRVINYNVRTLKALHKKNLVDTRSAIGWSWAKRFWVRASRAGEVAFRHAQMNPETIIGR